MYYQHTYTTSYTAAGVKNAQGDWVAGATIAGASGRCRYEHSVKGTEAIEIDGVSVLPKAIIYLPPTEKNIKRGHTITVVTPTETITTKVLRVEKGFANYRLWV